MTHRLATNIPLQTTTDATL